MSELVPDERERIYTHRIRAAFLGGLKPAATPTVIFVGGVPGSGKTNVMRLENARLPTPGAIVSGDDMREFHPGWRQAASRDVHPAARFDSAASEWVERLARDAMRERLNVVFETTFRRLETVAPLLETFRTAGYQVEATFVATPLEATRRAVVARFLDLQARGQPPRFVAPATLLEAYRSLPKTVEALERQPLVDVLRVVSRQGEVRYANRRDAAGQWEQPAAAVIALEAERSPPRVRAQNVRERAQNPRAQNALAWQILEARARANPDTPREVIEQAAMWRRDAIERARADPETATIYNRLLAAEAFRTYPRARFLNEFPAYAGAVDRLDASRAYALKNLPFEAEQRAFITRARERIAEYIEHGQRYRPRKDHEPPSR
ncbi:MAG: zeta toxin family protein [Burkholderiales bacterium]|jgi:hypothetical protein|nr:zeta toxin family protein [Burkholderiales bacterium]